MKLTFLKNSLKEPIIIVVNHLWILLLQALCGCYLHKDAVESWGHEAEFPIKVVMQVVGSQWPVSCSDINGEHTKPQ